jgi:hypothetical protein
MFIPIKMVIWGMVYRCFNHIQRFSKRGSARFEVLRNCSGNGQRAQRSEGEQQIRRLC